MTTPPPPPPPSRRAAFNNDEMHVIMGGSLVWGGAEQFVKGLYRGKGGLASAKQAVGMKALRSGGKWAVYFTLISAFESTSAKLRGKDDFWNPTIAFASTVTLTDITKKRSTFGLLSLQFIAAGILALPYFWGWDKLSQKKT